MHIPTIEHDRADPPAGLIKATEQLIKTLPIEHPELGTPEELQELIPTQLIDGPTLHLDDLSEISLSDTFADNRFYQDRARLRAYTGDMVASCARPIEGYEEYCRDLLGLGSPEWVRPRPARRPLRIADACWEDSEVRYQLCQNARNGNLSYIHPHMGTLAVWELALLIYEYTGVPVRVIAPPPPVTQFVNNKVAFMETVERLFGPHLIPATRSAWNLALLAKNVRELVEMTSAIGLKLPDAAGGEGNIVLQTAPLRGKSLSEIEQVLRSAVARLDWQGQCELLVDVWETHVFSSPSCQLWIPPGQSGSPIVEGVFTQNSMDQRGTFVGATPAQLPTDLRQTIVDHCWLLGRLFQGLGYVGRCSFDLILIGEHLEDCQFKFLECNGRWGGTSLPMTLMNRIFGDFPSKPFAVHIIEPVKGLDRISFADLLSEFSRDLFDIRTGKGSLILFNPGRIQQNSGVSTIVLGDSWSKIAERGCQELLTQLEATCRSFAQTSSKGTR